MFKFYPWLRCTPTISQFMDVLRGLASIPKYHCSYHLGMLFGLNCIFFGHIPKDLASYSTVQVMGPMPIVNGIAASDWLMVSHNVKFHSPGSIEFIIAPSWHQAIFLT